MWPALPGRVVNIICAVGVYISLEKGRLLNEVALMIPVEARAPFTKPHRHYVSGYVAL